jgi:hypothetical protein
MAFCGEGPHGSFSTGRPNGSFGTGRPGGPNGHGWARALSWRAGVYRSDHDATTTRSGGVLGHLAVMLVGAERLSDLAGLGPAGAARPGRLDPTARLVERVATDPRRVGVGIAVMRSNTAVRPNTHQGGKAMDQQKGWSAWLLPTDADSELRPHPNRDASKSAGTRRRIPNVSAGEGRLVAWRSSTSDM